MSNSLSPKLKWPGSKITVEFKESCLKQDKVALASRNVVNLFIGHELDRWSQDLKADFTLKDCLFEAFKLIKNAGLDKHSYSGYGIGLILVHFFNFQILIVYQRILIITKKIP